MSEKETVYLLGAGFNQCVNDWHGLKPPLATNFFQTILKSEKYQSDHYDRKVHSVYEYIEKYWKKSKEDLLNQPFDLEDCFTFLELQYYEAEKNGNDTKAAELATISFRLKTMLAEFLSEFEIFGHTSDLLREFGKQIYKEKPTIITFNYDCILETAIESASQVRGEIPDSFLGAPNVNGDVPDEELPYSHHNWNRPLGYGIKFDEIQLQRAGLSTYVEGHRFYSHPENNPYNWKILKLHGSLNWFRYLPIRKDLLFLGKEEQLSPEKLKDVILIDGHWWFNEPPDIDDWIIDPLIITPTLYKERFYQERLFSDLWNQAKLHLEKCARLIVIGYSFPPTDFAVRKLLLEAFEDNKLDDLIVVDPNTSVVKTIKELVHFTKPTSVCYDLKEFLRM
ncbi:MAG: hypothetical protein EMLJLAPB_00966 [Candidatus Argoarchaeum ethanivorans]|uniref:SIR2-like domain-containing protein n=1 Tax=Candidatus Argoarchaeum ethanivorans TaxID=2608793 RepID=A0A811TBU7_9EURY|nr:MAG: hypothetical protein EMLJLAPB_00966 [Candidatus Argoarchaeum ethanivorans]